MDSYHNNIWYTELLLKEVQAERCLDFTYKIVSYLTQVMYMITTSFVQPLLLHYAPPSFID